jgi:hypothetical protein
MPTTTPIPKKNEVMSAVYCPLCTHTVQATVVYGQRARVVPGQKCPRCSSSLDAGYVLRIDRAA